MLGALERAHGRFEGVKTGSGSNDLDKVEVARLLTPPDYAKLLFFLQKITRFEYAILYCSNLFENGLWCCGFLMGV